MPPQREKSGRGKMAGSNNMGLASVVAAALVALVGGTAFFFGTNNPAPTTPAATQPVATEVRETARQPATEKASPATTPVSPPTDKTTKPKPPPPDPG
ncbi:MAG: hypothetical protein JNM56_27540 [Planctomycetia bacterium]|nr:hypothetical protein [Planctomycetia bacterium]